MKLVLLIAAPLVICVDSTELTGPGEMAIEAIETAAADHTKRKVERRSPPCPAADMTLEVTEAPLVLRILASRPGIAHERSVDLTPGVPGWLDPATELGRWLPVQTRPTSIEGRGTDAAVGPLIMFGSGLALGALSVAMRVAHTNTSEALRSAPDNESVAQLSDRLDREALVGNAALLGAGLAIVASIAWVLLDQ